METKGITCKIPLELHNRISEEIRASGSTMSKFIEQVINSYYEQKEKGENNMSKPRTLAFQISEELFQKVKEYLDEYTRVYGRKLTQKEFVIGLVEQALEEAEEEFEAARAARGKTAAEQDDMAEPDETGDAHEGSTEPDGAEDTDGDSAELDETEPNEPEPDENGLDGTGSEDPSATEEGWDCSGDDIAQAE